MSGFFMSTSGPGDGLFFSGHVARITNRSGATTGIGEVVMLDLAQGDGDVDNAIEGSSDATGNNSAYNNYIDPAITAPFLKHYIYGIALESIANDAVGAVLFRGHVNAAVATATVVGTALVPAANGELVVADGTLDAKVVAISEEIDVSNLANVLFDGIHGFGWDTTT